MLKLNVHVKRTVPGDQDFSSRSVCVGLEAECSETLINNPDDLQRKISGLLDEVDEAVLLRLQGEKPQDKNQDFRNRIAVAVNGNGNGSNGNGHPPEQAATNKQLTYLRALAKKAQLSREDLNEVVTRVTGRRHLGDGLTKGEAHLLIEELQQQPEPAAQEGGAHDRSW